MNNHPSGKSPYPTQPSYPTQAGPSAYPQAQRYPSAPPAYTPYAQAPQYPQSVPTNYAPQHPQAFPQQTHPYQQQYYQPPQQQTVVVKGGFDAGARFGATGPSIPPPPPGHVPTASQVAHAQGHNVVVTKQKDNYFLGGSDGGYVFW